MAECKPLDLGFFDRLLSAAATPSTSTAALTVIAVSVEEMGGGGGTEEGGGGRVGSVPAVRAEELRRHVAAAAPRQGLELVHFSAQRERVLWDRGCV